MALTLNMKGHKVHTYPPGMLFGWNKLPWHFGPIFKSAADAAVPKSGFPMGICGKIYNFETTPNNLLQLTSSHGQKYEQTSIIESRSGHDKFTIYHGIVDGINLTNSHQIITIN